MESAIDRLETALQADGGQGDGAAAAVALAEAERENHELRAVNDEAGARLDAAIARLRDILGD